ncbi:MAG: hypothetical protein LUD03_05550 [Firmicutes bacterium]|nr:hypothetical protein [Bacillota bacterium]
MFEKPKKIWYDDIQKIELTGSGSDSDKTLDFSLADGTTYVLNDICVNKTPLMHLLEEMIKCISDLTGNGNIEVKFEDNKVMVGTFTGLAAGNIKMTDKLISEKKFNARQGHGFAAERANNLVDKFSGKDARIVGDDNAKYGADRIVNGVKIQSKYCATGEACVKDCFSENGSGTFKYMSDGKPMKIEVPSDKYEAAVEAMEKKIRNGQVPGVSDPKEAKNIVKKGHFTYKQAKNIAKAGTVESITYDAASAAVISASAMGITATLTFATSVWNGEDFDVCLKSAVYSGLRVGGTTFITTILVSQLTKAGLNSALTGSTVTLTKFMGYRTASAIAGKTITGKSINGIAAINSAAKILRTNIITSMVTIGVFSTIDVANMFQGKISGGQLFKNIANTTTSTVAGIGGFIAGQAMIPIPVIGGIIGAAVLGSAASKATNAITGQFIEDDANEMVRIIEREFKDLANSYLLNQKEAEKSIDKLREILDGKKLKEMYASSDRGEFARELLTPIIEAEVNKRGYVSLPDNEQVSSMICTILDGLENAEPEMA